MQNKPSDVKYCGINKNKLDLAKPELNQDNLALFYEWLTERYQIHIKKDVKKSLPPWTNNQVLQKYRFTNVRREQDKESLWLINNVSSNNNLDYENKILNSILFRLINKSQTVKIFGLIDFNKINYPKITSLLDSYKDKNPEYVYFSNAFYTSGPKTIANKLFGKKNNIINMIKLVELYKNENITDKIKSTKNQQEVYFALKSCPGIGKFLAYQIFIDLAYMNEFPFSENEFVVAGPGCIKGLNMLFKDFGSLSYEEALFWLRDNQNEVLRKFRYNPDELFSDLQKEERYLNLMCIEGCMCETSKYIRAVNREGRPRIRYNPK